jgi:hypothetical protein
MITHAEAERLLFNLRPGASSLVLGVPCGRDRSGFCWHIGDGPDGSLLLPALDTLMREAGFRPAAAAGGPPGPAGPANRPRPPPRRHAGRISDPGG